MLKVDQISKADNFISSLIDGCRHFKGVRYAEGVICSHNQELIDESQHYSCHINTYPKR